MYYLNQTLTNNDEKSKEIQEEESKLLNSQTVTNSSNSDAEECIQHRQSNIIEFTSAGKKIQIGSCLGHSQNGSISFSGIDLETGNLLFITEWMIKYSQLEAKCETICQRDNSDIPCIKHGVDEVIANIENQMMDLIPLTHTNLVDYKCVQCVKKTDGILVHLAQDFVNGITIGNLSHSLDWSDQNIRMVARSVVDALIFLHSKDIKHCLLNDMAVYLDNCSTIRLTDFALVPYLQELIGLSPVIKSDLSALGILVESLSTTPSSSMMDFIEKCTSQDELLAVDLLDDPFIQPELQYEFIPNDEQENKIDILTSNCIGMSASITSSRYLNEFITLENLGEGGFGEVYKAKNKGDNQVYAIKKILIPENKQNFTDTVNREVWVLAELRHENIVRYFTNWYEWEPDDDKQTILGSVESPSSSFIVFKNPSNGKDDNENFDAGESQGGNTMLKFLYIKMEYCDGSTLRTVINNQLFTDVDRLWRFFREIVEGLAYIHKKGIIHRDLKPANIFISSEDQIKIGDFGLSTSCRLGLENKEVINCSLTFEVNKSLTDVGTTLYKAPELEKDILDYDQKIDLYSLGIILFEMSCAKFNTEHERLVTLNALRTPEIIMPNIILDDQKYERNVKVIRWLLNHNPDNRPTVDELLISELVPQSNLEINKFDEMVRNTIVHQRSKQYKNLVMRCLEQESEIIEDLEYNNFVVYQQRVDFVKSKIVNLFRKHGAIEVATPLLTLCSKNYVIGSNAVRLMTQSGKNIFLPHNLRLPFARYIAINGIQLLRRYSIDRVYREEKRFNSHPYELYECAFDIVTPNRGNLVLDAELIFIASEITKLLPALRQKKISIQINHTTLLRAILMDFNVPLSNYDFMVRIFLDYMDDNMAISQIKHLLTKSTLQDCSAAVLLNMVRKEYSIVGGKIMMDGSHLHNTVNSNSSAGFLARKAIRDLESVVRLAQGLGVSVEINLLPCLSIGYDRTKSGGIIWKMIAAEQQERNQKHYTLATGERYDSFLSEFQKVARDHLTKTKVSGAGFSFYLHAPLICSSVPGYNVDWASVQVLLCLLGKRPPLNDVTEILTSLWSAGISSGIVEVTSSKNSRDISKKLGSRHLVVQNEKDGLWSIGYWYCNQNMRQKVLRGEVINTIKGMIDGRKGVRSKLTN